MLRGRNTRNVQERLRLRVLPIVLAPFLRGLAVPLVSIRRAHALGGGLRRRIKAPGAVTGRNRGFRGGVSSLLGTRSDEAGGGRSDDCGRGPRCRGRQCASGRAGHAAHGGRKHFVAARACAEVALVQNDIKQRTRCVQPCRG